MKVFVDNRESGALTQTQWKEARKLLPGHPDSGRVMNLNEARRAQLRRGMMIGGALLVLGWILALIFAIVGSSDGAIAMLFAASSFGLRPVSAFGFRFP
jgi:hypothetical protein